MMKGMTDFELGYTIGLFEGEGSVYEYSARPRQKSYKFLRLEITNTNLNLLKQAQKISGGHIKRKKRYKPQHSPCYALCLDRKDEIIKLLRKMRPFLIAQRERVEYFLRKYGAIGAMNPNPKGR